jgi:hypothetical protein
MGTRLVLGAYPTVTEIWAWDNLLSAGRTKPAE